MGEEFPFWIDDWAAHDPGRVAICFENREITYAALSVRIDFLQARLIRTGLLPGDRVAYLGDNRPDAVALAFACARVQLIYVPLNWRLAAVELKVLFEDCKPGLLLCDEEFAATGAQLAASCGTPLAMLRQGEIWFDCLWPKVRRFPDLREPRVDPAERIALLMYTSGTTGLPKGAAHSIRGVEATARNVIDGYALTGDDHVLAYLPLFHVGGLTMLVLPALKIGARVILHRRFNAEQAIDDIGRHRATMLLGVATTLRAMIVHPLWAACDTSSLRLVMTGASIIPVELLRVFFDRRIIASQVLGATEMGIGTCLKPCDAARKIGFVGTAARHSQVKLVKPDGTEAGAGEEGELAVSGPGVMVRYWNHAERMSASFRDGWFYTGDLARRDGEGFYTLVSRIKEIIISGGENIYPAEIENVLLSDPDVEEAAVVGGPSKRWGETPVAFVVRKPGSRLTEDDLKILLSNNLSRFKQPSEIRFVDALPRNAMGKILRAELQRILSDVRVSQCI